jgi:MFS family permease
MVSSSGFGRPPIFLKFRSSTSLIVSTVAIGLFTDLFLYGIIVPILPFLLSNRIGIPPQNTQNYTSILLAVYAGSSILYSLPAGIIADKLSSRQVPFLAGLFSLLGSTILLSAGQSIATLIVARVLQGISAATVWTVGLALIIDTVGPEKLGVTIGSIFSVISIGALLAPVLGGIVYDKAGDGAVFGMGFALLGVDLFLRLLLIEKKVATRYDISDEENDSSSGDEGSSTAAETFTSSSDDETPTASEQTPLLDSRRKSIAEDEDLTPYILHTRPRSFLPILPCLRNPRLLTCQLITLTHASTLGLFDATLPLEAHSLFTFTALRSGLLFIPLVTPCLVLGPAAGWGVDKWGPRPFAIFGLLFLSVPMFLLQIPHPGGAEEIAKMCAILALCGIALPMISSPAIVESSKIMDMYHRANRGYLGEKGPYAQLYAVNNVVFSTGLTVGPLVAGLAREKWGFGMMGMGAGVWAVGASGACLLSIGQRKKQDEETCSAGRGSGHLRKEKGRKGVSRSVT